ncbi:hypothetical protein EKN09_17735 [Vibrio penaeicida]|uniref:Uncharacterized protein n=2 Tax=Vibrio penaeicida TaxID=104609 RepID=A0AAV5NQL5_9VIBR|nr:hypothetical protein [Vibrio penaeicida]RTZ21752.1 hypothetical protein EKN09_17735 [Vibrio penaeicida]GLQ72915.1 hypothetical protein GCM10007932_22750 [Vibrio penaeicida]
MRIDVPMMRGEIPRLAPHLLPNEAATHALDCQFGSGVVEPVRQDALALTLPIAASTFVQYQDSGWLAWATRVHAIPSPIAQDPHQRIYWTGQGKPKVTSQERALNAQGVGPQAWYDLGVPAPETAPVITAVDSSTGLPPPAGEPAMVDDEDRVYLQTYVTQFGEEGAPGPPSTPVLIEQPGSTVTLRLTTPGTNRHNLTHTRLYRSVTSAGISEYVLVAQLPISVSTFSDTHATVSGAVLETDTFALPDANLSGLCLMANGICAGFAGNEVMFSEAYLPYAWPTNYRLTTQNDIVAMSPVGTSLVVGTTGQPYVFSGVTPSAMTATKLNIHQACVSADSMVVLRGTVVYASPDGLVSVSSEGGELLSEAVIDRQTWQALSPDTIRAVSIEGQYFATHQGGSFLFDPVSQSLTRVSERWDAAYYHGVTDQLYLASGHQIRRWRSAETLQSYTWRSKPFVLSSGALMSCAQIDSPAPERLSVTFYADGVEILQLSLGQVTTRPFRLPAVRAARWQIAITGTSPVERIQIASDMRALQ